MLIQKSHWIITGMCGNHSLIFPIGTLKQNMEITILRKCETSNLSTLCRLLVCIFFHCSYALMRDTIKSIVFRILGIKKIQSKSVHNEHSYLDFL